MNRVVGNAVSVKALDTAPNVSAPFDPGNRHALLRHNGAAQLVPVAVTPGGVPIQYGVRLKNRSPLARYLERGVIGEAEYMAGEYLGRLYAGAVLPQRITSSYGERVSGGGRSVAQESAFDARSRLWKLMLKAGLASKQATEVPFEITLRSGIRREALTCGIRLTKAGHLVLGVAVYDQRPGGTRNLKGMVDGLRRLADATGMYSRAAGRIEGSRVEDVKPVDAPEVRDFRWAQGQAERRRTRESVKQPLGAK